MKRKKIVLIGTLTVALLVVGNSIHADARCSEWVEKLGKRTDYCATPVCYTGNRTEFIETVYERDCMVGLFQTIPEYDYVKFDNGCCPKN